MSTTKTKYTVAAVIIVTTLFAAKAHSRDSIFTTMDLDVRDYAAYVNGVSHLNVRSGPGRSYPVLGVLSSGIGVLVTHHNNGWGRLKSTGFKDAYVYLGYMSTNTESYEQTFEQPSFDESMSNYSTASCAEFSLNEGVHDPWWIAPLAIAASLSSVEIAVITLASGTARYLFKKNTKNQSC